MTHPAASPTRARIATVVIVGRSERLIEAATVLGGADEAGALRLVLISTEPEPLPALDSELDIVSIGGLRPEHVDNAIAGVRLSSLPTVVWWRDGSPERLDGVAALADRVVLDSGEDPWPLWARTPRLFDETSFTDLRWTRLTRWRAEMAHFFDLAEVRNRAGTFKRLVVGGSDRAQCALFAGWLDASLDWDASVTREFIAGTAAMECVTLTSDAGELSLRLRPNRTCLETEARVSTSVLASRVVSLGDQHERTLMSEELRVRSRDLAFERALERALRHRRDDGR